MRLSRAPFLRWQHSGRVQIGLNCFQPFGYGYPFENGGNDATVMPDARLTKIRTVFDFVRMVVDPEALLTADSASNVTTTELDARIAELIAGVDRRTALGLKVMVDFHFHLWNVSIQAGWNFIEVFDGGTKATRVGFVLARLGAAIHTYGKSGMVCLEIFNEPPHPGDISTAAYITQIEAWWAQVRAAMPLHTIIVGGNELNAIDGTPAGDGTSGLTALTPSHFDANTGFSFHPYESGAFTHQGVDGSIYQYGHDIKFPAADNAGGSAAVKTAFSDAATAEGNHDGIVAADAVNAVVTQTAWSSSINEYFATYGSKALLAARLAVVTAWSDAASIDRNRLFNTEFGVNFAHASDDATDASAAAFVQATREIAADAGINCICIHEAQGSNFGIQATSTPWAFNASIETALTAPYVVGFSFVNAEAEAFYERLTGTYSDAEKEGIDDWFTAVKASPGLAKIDAVYARYLDGSPDSLLNMVADQHNSTITGTCPYTAGEGFESSGGGSELDNGFNPSTASSPKYTLNSAHRFIAKKSAAVNGGLLLGPVGGYADFYPRWTDGSMYARCNSGPTYAQAVADASGQWCLTRTDGTEYRIYRHDTLVATPARASVGIDNANLSDIPGLTDITYMSGFGSGLTTGEWQAYRAANTALGAVFGITI